MLGKIMIQMRGKIEIIMRKYNWGKMGMLGDAVNFEKVMNWNNEYILRIIPYQKKTLSLNFLKIPFMNRSHTHFLHSTDLTNCTIQLTHRKPHFIFE